MFKRNSSKLALLGILILALSACTPIFEDVSPTGTSTAPVTTKDPIQIGVLLPVSSALSSFGNSAKLVLQIAANDINTTGGIAGRQVELIFADSSCDGSLTETAMNDLVTVKKVKVVIGGFCSPETLLAAKIAEQNKVVLLSPTSSSPKITNAGDFVFRNYPSDTAQGEVLGFYANKKGFKKVAILMENQPYSQDIADSFTSVFYKLGGQVTTEKFEKDATDISAQITKLKEATPDAFFIDAQSATLADIIVTGLKTAEIKGPFIVNDVTLSSQKDIVEKYKDFLEGSVGAEVPYDKNNPAFFKLAQSYKLFSSGQELPSPSYMAPTYDSLFIIKEAIEASGEDPVKIKDYLYTVRGRKGVAGTLSFDVNGDPTSDYKHVLRVVKNGVVENYKE
jgi:branched-chain amino acid transport system substrate-binding protein